MNAFCTGCMGFLGSHLLERLQADGWNVTVYDRKPRPPLWTTDYVVGDVRDAHGLELAMIEARPDVVFHLAALADVRNALPQRHDQLQLNLVATFNVLEAMKASGCSRIAFTSTAVVYGDTESGVWDIYSDTIKPRAISERSHCYPQQTSI